MVVNYEFSDHAKKKVQNTYHIFETSLWIILLSLIDSIFLMAWRYMGLKLLNLWYIVMESSFWHPHTSRTIRNIESITKSKIIQSVILYGISILKLFSAWSENPYFAIMGWGHFFRYCYPYKLSLRTDKSISES